MKFRLFRKLLATLLSVMLIAVMAFTVSGCKNDTPSADVVSQKNEITIQSVGEGEKTFTFSVIDKDKNETRFDVKTDKETVGDALLEYGLISGEESQYGLYVKTVNGITADFDKDGVYWAFYINDSYAVSGVDTTPITDGEVYSFRIEK